MHTEQFQGKIDTCYISSKYEISKVSLSDPHELFSHRKNRFYPEMEV